MSGFLPPPAHIRDEPVVILRQRTALWLIEVAGLGHVVSGRARSADRDVYAELVALVHLGSSAVGSVNGTAVADANADDRELITSPRGGLGMATAEVAALAETTTRAVTRAIQERRIPAQRVGRTYVIAEADAHDYARRTAKKGAA